MVTISMQCRICPAAFEFHTKNGQGRPPMYCDACRRSLKRGYEKAYDKRRSALRKQRGVRVVRRTERDTRPLIRYAGYDPSEGPWSYDDYQPAQEEYSAETNTDINRN